MKVLTIRQPWATLIVRGIKDVENRTWATSYRGPLLIHAARRDALLNNDQWSNLLALLPDRPQRAELARGVILGRVTLGACSRFLHVTSPWHEAGSIGWLFTAPAHFACPIPTRGRLGLWDAPDDITSWITENGKSRTHRA